MEDKMLGEIFCLSSHPFTYCSFPSVFAWLPRLHCVFLQVLLSARDLTECCTRATLASRRNSI